MTSTQGWSMNALPNLPAPSVPTEEVAVTVDGVRHAFSLERLPPDARQWVMGFISRLVGPYGTAGSADVRRAVVTILQDLLARAEPDLPGINHHPPDQSRLILRELPD